MHLQMTTSSFIDWSMFIPMQDNLFIHYFHNLIITHSQQCQAIVLTAMHKLQQQPRYHTRPWLIWLTYTSLSHFIVPRICTNLRTLLALEQFLTK